MTALLALLAARAEQRRRARKRRAARRRARRSDDSDGGGGGDQTYTAFFSGTEAGSHALDREISRGGAFKVSLAHRERRLSRQIL